jgi:membrane-associated protein
MSASVRRSRTDQVRTLGQVVLAFAVPSPDLSTLGAVAIYAVIWGFVFAECGLLIGFLLPGDTILFAAGLVAAAPGSEVNLALLIAGTLVAAIAGNHVGFVLGRRYGRTWVEQRSSTRARDHARRAEGFYARYGAIAVVVARWIPWVRTFTPVVAGAADMAARRFTVANVAGALPWAIGLPLLGYLAYDVSWLRASAYVGVVLSLVVTVITLLTLLIGRTVRSRRAGTQRVEPVSGALAAEPSEGPGTRPGSGTSQPPDSATH